MLMPRRKACIRAERNALLAGLAEDMVHSDKEVILNSATL